MNTKVIGFILVAAAIVLAVAALVSASPMHPDHGFIMGVQNARTFQTGHETYALECRSSIYDNCPASGFRTGQNPVYLAKLSHVLILATALGLGGIGMIVFGRREG